MEKLLLKNITNNYILKNLSLSINKGTIHGLVGENGAGKSSLLKIISGMDKKYKGTLYFIDSKNNNHIRTSEKSIAALIENPAFYSFLSGEQNIKQILSLYNKKINKKEIDSILHILDIYHARKKKVYKYSLGMKQRLALAQIFLINPEIIVLDEPFNGLDPKITINIKNYLINLKNRGKFIIISSHILKDIEDLSDKISMLKKGEIIYETSSNIDDQSLYTYLIKVNERKQAINILYKEEIRYETTENDIKITTNKENVPRVIKTLVQNNINIYQVYRLEENLEEIFLKYNS